MRRHALAAGLLLATGAAAGADEAPSLIPNRDVSITYRVTRDGRTVQERTRWLAAQKLERVDLSGPLYMIANHATHRIAMVNRADGSVLEMDAPVRQPWDPGPDVSFTRKGEDNVAGLPCTEWEALSPGGDPATLCATQDGVLLRLRKGGKTEVEATRVRYRSLSPQLFQVPANAKEVPSPAAAPPPPGPSGPPAD